MAIEIGSDCFLQLVVRRRLLKPQAQVVLQVLVELVTWKEQERGEIESTHFNVTQQQNLLLRRRRRLLRPCAVIQAKIKVAKGRDISNANVPLATRVHESGPAHSSLHRLLRRKEVSEHARNITPELYISGLQREPTC